jgi:choline dehydrogenase-like flavoprotein
MKLLREPLLHFLVLGAAIFGAYAWLGHAEDAPGRPASVVLREADVAWLADIWSRQWHRQPTAEELRGLVGEYLKEELLSREAREMKLDENDIVIRRRLAQKLSFIVQDTAEMAEPSDEELHRLYDENAGLFQTGSRISFRQVYFNPNNRADARHDALLALAGLSALAEPTELGDRLMVEANSRNATQERVAAAFGPEFARTVFALRVGEWSGPITSGFGLHLVNVSELQVSQPQAFADVRPKLLTQWRDAKQAQANASFLAGLQRKYEVVAEDKVKPLLEAVLAKQAGK